MTVRPTLKDPRISQSILKDCLLDRGKDESDISGISGLCQANIMFSDMSLIGEHRYILRINAQPRPIDLHKAPKNVLCGFIDVWAACIVREILF
jgi:hypothetical protein